MNATELNPTEVAAREREFDAAIEIEPPNPDALWAMYRYALDRAIAERSRFSAANAMLHDAAQTLVDCLELPNNGRDAGVVFKVPLEVGK